MLGLVVLAAITLPLVAQALAAAVAAAGIAAGIHMAAAALDYLGKVPMAVAALAAVKAEAMVTAVILYGPERVSVAAQAHLQMVALAVFVLFGLAQGHSQVLV